VTANVVRRAAASIIGSIIIQGSCISFVVLLLLSLAEQRQGNTRVNDDLHAGQLRHLSSMLVDVDTSVAPRPQQATELRSEVSA